MLSNKVAPADLPGMYAEAFRYRAWETASTPSPKKASRNDALVPTLPRPKTSNGQPLRRWVRFSSF